MGLEYKPRDGAKKPSTSKRTVANDLSILAITTEGVDSQIDMTQLEWVPEVAQHGVHGEVVREINVVLIDVPLGLSAEQLQHYCLHPPIIEEPPRRIFHHCP